MKVCPLTKISSLAPEICSPYQGCLLHPALPLPTEHTVVLVGSILQVFKGFMISCQVDTV